jgi:D-erythronate 2-dehydrogenase
MHCTANEKLGKRRMKIAVVGAAGMLGSGLIQRLAQLGVVAGAEISALARHDCALAGPPPASAFPIETHITDLSAPGAAESVIASRPDLIFHLAAIVSGEAEADFENGYRVNMDGARHLLEAVRLAGASYCPKLIFTSSIAVFGSPFPDRIGDDFLAAPLTSYGTQKAICELLISDYSRKGFIDGMSLRMPTVCVRPGAPNKAASGFFSNIIREPLAGKEAVLPVEDSVRHWFASPRAAVRFLIQAAELAPGALGDRRALTLPGLSCTVAEQIAALERIAGAKAVKLIRREPDETIARIVSGWPQNFNAARAQKLGFAAEISFDEIIAAHIEDEQGGALN